MKVASVTVMAMTQGLIARVFSLAPSVNGIVAAAMFPPACLLQIIKETDRSQNIAKNNLLPAEGPFR